jgi:hypothetical protein
MNTMSFDPAQSEQAHFPTLYGPTPGSVSMILRTEGLIELMVAVSAYRYFGGSWTLFALLFLVPDLSMLGYLVNRRFGARLYNIGHTYISSTLLALCGLAFATPLFYSLALIWAAHIGFDRMVGYGLKYPTGFKTTHLSWKDSRVFATS